MKIIHTYISHEIEYRLAFQTQQYDYIYENMMKSHYCSKNLKCIVCIFLRLF